MASRAARLRRLAQRRQDLASSAPEPLTLDTVRQDGHRHANGSQGGPQTASGGDEQSEAAVDAANDSGAHRVPGSTFAPVRSGTTDEAGSSRPSGDDGVFASLALPLAAQYQRPLVHSPLTNPAARQAATRRTRSAQGVTGGRWAERVRTDVHGQGSEVDGGAGSDRSSSTSPRSDATGGSTKTRLKRLAALRRRKLAALGPGSDADSTASTPRSDSGAPGDGGWDGNRGRDTARAPASHGRQHGTQRRQVSASDRARRVALLRRAAASNGHAATAEAQQDADRESQPRGRGHGSRASRLARLRARARRLAAQAAHDDDSDRASSDDGVGEPVVMHTDVARDVGDLAPTAASAAEHGASSGDGDGDGDGGGGGGGGGPSSAAEAVVADQWFEYVDERSGRKFYYNKATGRKTWRKPRDRRVRDAVVVRRASLATAMAQAHRSHASVAAAAVTLCTTPVRVDHTDARAGAVDTTSAGNGSGGSTNDVQSSTGAGSSAVVLKKTNEGDGSDHDDGNDGNVDGDGEYEGYGDGEYEGYGDGEYDGYGDGEYEGYEDGEYDGYGDGEYDGYGDGEYDGYGDGEYEGYGDGTGGDNGEGSGYGDSGDGFETYGGGQPASGVAEEPRTDKADAAGVHLETNAASRRRDSNGSAGGGTRASAGGGGHSSPPRLLRKRSSGDSAAEPQETAHERLASVLQQAKANLRRVTTRKSKPAMRKVEVTSATAELIAAMKRRRALISACQSDTDESSTDSDSD